MAKIDILHPRSRDPLRWTNPTVQTLSKRNRTVIMDLRRVHSLAALATKVTSLGSAGSSEGVRSYGSELSIS